MGVMVAFFQSSGTVEDVIDLLNSSVNIGEITSEQVFSKAYEMPSGPEECLLGKEWIVLNTSFSFSVSKANVVDFGVGPTGNTGWPTVQHWLIKVSLRTFALSSSLYNKCPFSDSSGGKAGEGDVMPHISLATRHHCWGEQVGSLSALERVW